MLALSLLVAGCQTQDVATPIDPADPASPEDEVVTGEADGDTPTPDTSTDTPAADAREPDAPVTAQPDTTISSDQASNDMVSVAIYTMDDQCMAYETETVQVKRDEAMTQAVGKVMAVAQTYDQFELAGYRLSYDDDSDTATIDLRLSPESARQFVSLTSCEQRSLFGSVEETLRQNTDWAVETVEFTNRGEDLLM